MILGSFDILHYGHMALLKFAKELAGEDDLVVALNSDEFITQFKRPPTLTFEERKKTLLSLPWVNQVVLNKQPQATAGTVMLENKIKMVISGSDWLAKDLLKQWDITVDWLNDTGICVCFFPFFETQGMSSSIIKEKVRSAS